MQQGRAMTQGTEWKLILLFTLPIMAGQFLQQLYNTVDGLIVGNFVSEDALSAVGTCAPVTMLFIAIALGMSTGCSIIISQYYGAGKLEELRRAVSTSLILLIGMGLVLSVVGGAVAKWLLQNVLAVKAEILPDATAYFAIYCVGLVFQFAYNIVSFILRSLGDSKATLYFLLVSSVTNILLDLLFVLAFNWGVPGVAIATVIAQALSAVVSLVYMFKKYEILRFSRKELRFHRDMGLTALKLGIPTTLQQCVVSFGHIAIQRIINDFDITAAMTAATRIENFVLIPIFSVNAGMATFTGQNLGAGKLDRVKRGLRGGWTMSAAAAGTLGVVVLVLGGFFAGWFGLEGESVVIAERYLRFTALFIWIFALHMATSGALQGAGDVVFTAFATVASLVLRCVATYLLAYLTPLGMRAVWLAVPIGWGFNFCLTITRYKFGPWRDKGLVPVKEETP